MFVRFALLLVLLLGIAGSAAAQAVDLALLVSDGASNQRELRFGLDPSATPGIDPHLGEAELPPFPPAGVLEARFVGDGTEASLGLGSYRDYRPGSAGFEGAVVHRVRLQRGDGSAVTLSWNWPEGVTGRLQDVITGALIDVAMAGSGSYTVANPDGFNALQLTITYAGDVTEPDGPEVDLPLLISDGASSQRELRFGLDPSATPGIDPHLGEAELPPFPPAGVLEARFVGDGTEASLGLGSYRDYRPGSAGFEGAVVHRVRLQRGDGSAVTLSWNWPEGVTGRLQDVITGALIDVAMAGSGSYTVANPDGFNTLQLTVTYGTPNRPPVFLSTPPVEAPAFMLYEYEVITSDPDGDAVSLDATTLPTWLSFVDQGGGTGLLSGAPTNAEVGEHTVTLTASDGELTVEQSFTVTVMYVNRPPDFSSEPVTEATAFEPYLYEVVGNDPDGDPLTFATGPLPAWLSFTDNGDGTAQLAGTPTNDDVGTVEIRITVSDGMATTLQLFDLTVHYVNRPPAFESEPVTEATASEPYLYEVIASDPDGDVLTISAPTLPGWLAWTDSGNGTGSLSGTPQASDAGMHEVVLVVSDGELTAEQTFQVTVVTVNEPPVFTSEPVTEAMAFESYLYTVTATDPDGDALTFSAPVLPDWLALADAGDGTASLSGIPTNAEAGEHAVTLTVTDGEFTAEQSFTVTVTFVELPPAFTSDPVTEATAFEPYLYTVTAMDPEGNPITLSASELPGWLDFVDEGGGTGTLAGTPGNVDAGSVVVTLTATAGGLSVEQTFTLTVEGVLIAPVLVSPVSGASSVATRPQFYWQGIGLSVAYELQVAPNGDFAQALTFTGLGSTTFLLPTHLDASQSYAWRVRARQGEQAGPFSAVRAFTTTSGTTQSSPVVPGGGPVDFPESGVQIAFPMLEGEGEVFVTQHTQLPEPPPEGLFLIGGTYWTIDFDGPDAFTAEVCFSLDEFGEPGDLDQLVVLRRDNDAAPWEELETWLEPEGAPLWLCFATSQFSDFAAASTKDVSSEADVSRPAALAIIGTFPNPFTEGATVQFEVPEPTHVRLAVFDLLGREVAVLLDGPVAAGRQALRFEARELSAGPYFVRLSADGESQSRRVLLVR